MRPRAAKLPSQTLKLKGLGRGWILFLVTVLVHILLPDIIVLKLFQGLTDLTRKEKKKVS